MAAATGHTLTLLRAFPAALGRQLAAVDAAQLDWRPPSWEGIPSEQLTIRQQLCHLRDIEVDGYLQRFRRLLAEDDPLLPSIDGYVLVEARGYDRTQPQAALEAFAGARRQTLEILEKLAPPQLERSGRFEGCGRVTVRALMHFLASHDQQHLAGIQWLFGRQAAARTIPGSKET